jgi:hypothetical protein
VSLRRWLADHFRFSPPEDEHEQLEELVRFVIDAGLRLPHFEDPQRVVEVHQTQRRGSEVLTLETLELHTDGFVLLFRLAGGWRRLWFDLKERRVHVFPPAIGNVFVGDDLGTRYRVASRRESAASTAPGTPAVYGGLPAVPGQASRLFVTVQRDRSADLRFEIDLTP